MIKSEKVFWIAFGVLWGAAVLAGIENTRRGENPVLRYTGRGSYEHYWAFLLAYLIGGAVIAMLHSGWAEKLPGSSYTRTETPEGLRFDTLPARKFFAIWPTGAIGIIFVLSLPEIFFGNGPGAAFGFLACVAFGALLLLMAYLPKLWRPGRPRSFVLATQHVQTETGRVMLDAGSQFLLTNRLRHKDFKAAPRIHGQDNRIYYTPGSNPLAAHAKAGFDTLGADASTAVANGLGEMAHRYHVEMRARSWQLKLKSGGREHLLADGLDGGCAQALFDELTALRTAQPAS